MITSYRIFKTIHSSTWFDGEGAFRYGGRWNGRGIRVMYTAASLSLAALEMLVYLYNDDMIEEYSFAAVTFDEALITPVEDFGRLPGNWNESPVPDTVRAIGNRWALSGTSAVLRVPTAIIPGEVNYVINLAHPDVARIQFSAVNAFVFDERFSRKGPAKKP